MEKIVNPWVCYAYTQVKRNETKFKRRKWSENVDFKHRYAPLIWKTHTRFVILHKIG